MCDKSTVTYRWCTKSRSQTPPPRANEFPAMKKTAFDYIHLIISTFYNNNLADMNSTSKSL